LDNKALVGGVVVEVFLTGSVCRLRFVWVPDGQTELFVVLLVTLGVAEALGDPLGDVYLLSELPCCKENSLRRVCGVLPGPPDDGAVPNPPPDALETPPRFCVPVELVCLGEFLNDDDGGVLATILGVAGDHPFPDDCLTGEYSPLLDVVLDVIAPTLEPLTDLGVWAVSVSTIPSAPARG